MALTLGDGPFARPLRGSLNFDLRTAAPGHVLYLHQIQRRIRGELAGQTVVDTQRAMLLHETGSLPQWYIPLEDIRRDLLFGSDLITQCPFKGAARYWHLRVGERLMDNALWNYPEPIDDAPPLLAELGAFYFDLLDAWYEEGEQVHGHPRDPFHRVDTRRSSRHITVRLNGELIAESNRAVGVFETGLPARWYLPETDVRTELLTESTTTTWCPYKGQATYFSGHAAHSADIAWTYADPYGEALAIAGHLCFFGDGVDVTVA